MPSGYHASFIGVATYLVHVGGLSLVATVGLLTTVSGFLSFLLWGRADFLFHLDVGDSNDCTLRGLHGLLVVGKFHAVREGKQRRLIIKRRNECLRCVVHIFPFALVLLRWNYNFIFIRLLYYDLIFDRIILIHMHTSLRFIHFQLLNLLLSLFNGFPINILKIEYLFC